MILGPYFIEDEEGSALTITQQRYRDMVIGPVLQDLRRFCHARGLHMNRQWYQQDGATKPYRSKISSHAAGELSRTNHFTWY
jgi:hypothetical protein